VGGEVYAVDAARMDRLVLVRLFSSSQGRRVLQARRLWLEPERARSSSAALPWQQDRAETVGLELAGGGRRSAQQGGVEVGRALSEDAPEWSAAEAMGEERGHGREPNEP
jgi:hypothetical protein